MGYIYIPPPGGGGGGPHGLPTHTDANIVNPLEGEALVFTSGKWANRAVATNKLRESYTAEIILSGHRVVIVNPATGKLVYADPGAANTCTNIAGLTESAVAADATAVITRYGPVDEPTWNWAVDKPIILGANGVLTQVVPVSGFFVVVGFPITATRILFEVQGPIKLA